MELSHIIILLTTGTGIGLLSGLLGIGGGFIMTPVQYMVYLAMGVPASTAIKLAFGTSLLVIIPTAVSGVWRHSKKGTVWWKAAFILGGSGLLTSFGGANLATHLSVTALKTIFGVTCLVAGTRMLTARLPRVEQEPNDKPWLMVAWAIPIGILTGIIGVGGGIMMLPVLMLVLKLKMHQAVATSLAIMIFISIGGVTGYVINGLGVPDLPAYSFGYVHLPTWFLLAITSISMAQVGALTAHRLPAKQLRYMFIALMFYVGLKMLGVFEWLGLPL